MGCMTNWEVPQRPLNAVAASQASPAISGTVDHLRTVDVHALQVLTAEFAGDTELVVQIQGSMDSVSWYALAQALPPGNGVSYTAPSEGLLPARYTRVYATGQDADTSGTVTVYTTSGIS